MKNPSRNPGPPAGFSLVEVMVAMSIAVLALGLTLSTFLFGLRTMYKDTQRLATNANLRYFTAHVAKETLDSSEFYIFPTYQSLDGNVNLATDVSALETDAYDTEAAYGDCLVLVTRVSIEATAKVRQFKIYYRVVTDSANAGAIRYYESADYGSSGSSSSLTTLLNGVDLKTTPGISGSFVLAKVAYGRARPSPQSGSFPIFSSEAATVSPSNESVSINVEIVNGSNVNNVISSSSFNYTVSPRR
ncbi:MAG: prepilin-type N-terminal cleavage/methylation domain-containing protein [Opitutaceae bacterium]|nr:prepilin-type N-terminal cleavage/methylation domain-containing protein [Opitutaceae bacterium]